MSSPMMVGAWADTRVHHDDFALGAQGKTCVVELYLSVNQVVVLVGPPIGQRDVREKVFRVSQGRSHVIQSDDFNFPDSYTFHSRLRHIPFGGYSAE